VLRVSGKTGHGVRELLDEVVRLIPRPVGDPDAPARAMIFDSVYDIYRGVVTYVRVIDGKLTPREKIKMMLPPAPRTNSSRSASSHPIPRPSVGPPASARWAYLITGGEGRPSVPRSATP